MKKIIFSVAFLLLIIQNGLAQAPEGVNYQSVIRKLDGTVMVNASVGVKVEIRQNNPTGTVVYSESFNSTSSSQGLINLIIGRGTVINGLFSNIDWGNGPFFCEISIDDAGGSNYLSMGVQQLLSVPYALYAKESGNGPVGATGPQGPVGATGPAGATGPQGPIGPIGPTGAVGPAGPQGVIGANGPAGVAGPQGPVGPAGTTGSIGLTGPVGPQGIQGIQGPAGTDAQTLSISGQNLTISGGNTVILPPGGGTLDQAYDFGGAGLGRTITVDAGPVQLNGSGTNTAALLVGFSGTGNAINAQNTNASNSYAAIQGVTNSSSVTNSAIFGQSTGAARGVVGEVTATSTASAAVRGLNLRTNGGIGVEGVGYNGVSGETNYRDGFGVFGLNYDAAGPLTANASGVGGVGFVGVVGQTSDLANGGAGIFSMDDVVAAGTKNFRIDHPLDPENKYLNHFSIESNEVLNIYRGTVTCDATGNAVIVLPDYVSAININFSYQLTPIGAFAGLFIAKKMENGTFSIAGAQPGMEVSWQLTGTRNDAYMRNRPNAGQVEVEKRSADKGKYLQPEYHNQPASKSIFKMNDNK